MLLGSRTPIAWGETWKSMGMLERQQCHRDPALRGSHLLAPPRFTNASALNRNRERDENRAHAELLLVIPSSNERRVR
jgi:hypothetical protein